MNDFHADLKYSYQCEDESCWREVYASAFPTMIAMTCHREDGQHQRNGIDRSVILGNSKQVLIDEKARRIKDTSDIMLEFISNDRTRTPGWAEKQILADYIAYAFIPSGTAYLIPVIQMQAAWKQNKEAWIKSYGTRVAANNGYGTINCPVPTKVLYVAISKMLRVHFTPPQS